MLYSGKAFLYQVTQLHVAIKLQSTAHQIYCRNPYKWEELENDLASLKSQNHRKDKKQNNS